MSTERESVEIVESLHGLQVPGSALERVLHAWRSESAWKKIGSGIIAFRKTGLF